MNADIMLRNAAETLQGLETAKDSKDAFLLYGASLAILSHAETPPSASTAPAVSIEAELPAMKDFVPKSQIDELLQELLAAFVAYARDKGIYQSTLTEESKAGLLRQFDAMLDIQRQVFNMLRRGSDTREELERLKAFFSRLDGAH